MADSPAGRTGRLLPAWPSALAVIAHPDDESFGLGAVIGQLAVDGAAVHVLCFTRGEASTLNHTGAELSRARETELRQAGAQLGVASVTLLDYPDGGLASVPTQVSPTAVLWRRLQLQGECEHLRWLETGSAE